MTNPFIALILAGSMLGVAGSAIAAPAPLAPSWIAGLYAAEHYRIEFIRKDGTHVIHGDQEAPALIHYDAKCTSDVVMRLESMPDMAASKIPAVAEKLTDDKVSCLRESIGQDGSLFGMTVTSTFVPDKK